MSRSRDLDCEEKQESRIENLPSTSVSSRSSWGPGAQENQEFLSCSWYIATFLTGWEVICSQTDWIPGTLYIQKMTSWIPRVMFWVLVLHLFTFLLVFVLPVLWQLIISMVIDPWYPKYMISPSNYAKEPCPQGSLGTGESPWNGNSARGL